MVSAADVPPEELIAAVTVDLKKSIKMPAWAKFVKTGAGRQRPPEQEDWWWTRAASILRKVYLYGPVGVNRLRTTFGGRADRGVKPEKTVKAGGKIIREILKQLEGLGYIKKAKKGREITPKGQSYLDKKIPGFGKVEAESPKEEPKPELKPEVKEKPKEEVKSPKEKKPREETPKKEASAKPEVKKKQETKEKPKKEEKKPKTEKEGKSTAKKKPVLVSAKEEKKASTKPVKKTKTKKVKGVGKSK